MPLDLSPKYKNLDKMRQEKRRSEKTSPFSIKCPKKHKTIKKPKLHSLCKSNSYEMGNIFSENRRILPPNLNHENPISIGN